MKYIELQEAFELEVGVLDNNLAKPKTSDIEYWLNNAVQKFIKTRYTGNNPKRESFEQTQKRIDDLRTLVKYTQFNLTAATERYVIELPRDYMFTLGETAVIYSDSDCWPKVNGVPRTKRTDVTEATIENFDAKYNNSLSPHRFHNNSARPLRLYIGDEIQLYTDGNYYLRSYILTYLRKPEVIDLHKAPQQEYDDLPEHTQMEIVKMAAHMYMENTSNPRYESYMNEIITME